MEVPPELDKDKMVMKLIRAEITYLTACGWILYVPGLQDENGVWKYWAEPSEPKKLFTQREAINIQTTRDNI